MSEKQVFDLIVIGGGAAGFFGAITAAESCKGLRVLILEQNQGVLNKVKISGGGRCNVTHACFDPKELVSFYPRGNKELLGPFHKFQPGDTMDWFESRGVALKIEEDGRIFPVSNQSQSIIDCLTDSAQRAGVKVQTGSKVSKIIAPDALNVSWIVETFEQGNFQSKYVLLATGSSPMIWQMLEDAGHSIIPPVPSLFTFNIQHFILKDLQGISIPQAAVKVVGQSLQTEGPMLITHWGLSGPAVLKMSAWGARLFHAFNYRFKIQINWTGKSYEEVFHWVQQNAVIHPKKLLGNMPWPGMPSRLWKRLLLAAKIPEDLCWSQLDTPKEKALLRTLLFCELPVNGKSTFKEEFVTSGGIALDEVDFRTMESKKLRGLYLAGEVLDIDALTGGFNFQAAWTGAFLAGRAIAAAAS